MREKRLFGGTMINPFWAKAHLAGHRRTWRRLTVCLAAFGLLLAFLGPALARDGDLDPSFITGPGPFAGVQMIPEIRGQMGYPVNPIPPPDPPWTYQGCSLLYGTFYGVQVGTANPPNNGGNSCIARLNATGALDTNFLTNNQINGEIRAVYIYPHNDPNYPDWILIGGSFNVMSGSTAYANFARLKADGSLDTDFPQAFTSWGGAVNSFGVQGFGNTAKILVGGYNLRVAQDDNDHTYQLIRLSYDGSLDSGYTPWGAPNAYISGVKVYPDDGTTNANCARIWCIYPKPVGSGTYYALLLDTDFTSIKSFIGDETVNGPIYNMAKQSDNKWVICGLFNQVYNSGSKSWVTKNRVARLNADGSLDNTYGVGAGPNGAVTQISPMSSSDDRMVLAGSFTAWNGNPRGCLVRLTTTTGAEDNTFNTVGGITGAGADDRIQRLNWNSNGSGGWIYGYFRYYNGQANHRGGIAGVDADGNLTGSYANVTAQAGWPGMVYSLATQKDGKIIIGGDFNGVGGKYRGGFARLNPNGSLDPSFKSHLDGRVMSVAVQGDGKILVGGPFGECQGYPCTRLARLNPDGSLDATFKPMLVGSDNSLNDVNQVVPQSDGTIMIAGDIYNNTGDAPVARLYPDGTLDPAFFANVSSIPKPIPEAQWSWGSRIAAVAGGKYVLAGGYDTATSVNAGGFLGRLTSSGTLDTFGPSGNIQTMNGPVDDLLLQPDGRIVVSGFFSQITGGPARSGIARFSADGLLDTTFNPSLPLPPPPPPPAPSANTIIINAMALQPNGKILIEENFLYYSDDITWSHLGTQVARLNSDGSLDLPFIFDIPANGWYYPGGGNSILRLPNGKALIGGCYGTFNGTPAWSLVRIFAGPANYCPAALLLMDD